MDLYENQYYKGSKLFMLWIGQWPYDNSNVKLVLQFFILLLFLSGFNFSIAKLFTTPGSFEVYLEVFTPLSIIALCFTKYCSCWIKTSSLKYFLDLIKQDWHRIESKPETEIIEKFAQHAKMFGIFYMVCLYAGIGIFACVPFLPAFLDLVQPLNESRPRRHPFEAEYFVDSEKYYYPILAHMLILAVIVHTIAGATDWMLIIFVLHACALFSILGYRLEHLFDETESEQCRSINNYINADHRICVRLRCCVQEHLHCLKYVKDLNECYLLPYLVQLVLAVLILTTLLLRLYEKVTPLEDPSEAIVCAVHAGGLVFIIFLNVYPSQLMMNISEEIFYQAYYSRWYTASAKSQRLLLIFMRKAMEPSILTAAGLVSASVQTFAAIVQTSLSYFTVLYTVKN